MSFETPETPDNSNETENRFNRHLKGFADAGPLKMSPARISDYEAQEMQVPEPGQYSQNNGTIAAAMEGGEIVVWVQKEDPNAPRSVSYEEAIQRLEDEGYTESDFGVPKF